MTKPIDFTSELVGIVQRFAAVDAAAAQRIETEVRCRFGGQRVAISAKSATKSVTYNMVDERIRRRMSINEVARDLGVSRSTIYRLITKKSQPA